MAYYQKYVDEYAKNQLKQALVQYDRTLLVADNRRCEPKKFGGMLRFLLDNVDEADRLVNQVLGQGRDTRSLIVRLGLGRLWSMRAIDVYWGKIS